MRILFFTHYFPPEVNAPASRTVEMCKRWVRAGHQVTVITCAPNAPDGVLYGGYRNRLRQEEEVEGIRVIRVWTLIAANKGTVRRMVNYVSYMFSAIFHSFFVPRPDIVLATTPQLFCGWAGAVCAYLRRTRFIVEMRDMFAESITTLTAVKQGFLIRLIWWLEFRLYQCGERLVTVGPGYRRRLIDAGVPESHISVITNGVDREFFDDRINGQPLREQWGIQDRFVCTYAGTIGMAHGLEVVLQAGRLLRDQHDDRILFLLVGEGAERQRLEQQARECGLTNVRFVGKQPKSMMPQILAASDCCLVHLMKAPLYTSVLPSKIFETAHMKRPIILGVEGDAAQVIQTSGGGICIEPGNAEELIAAVKKLSENEALCRELGERGHTYVGQYYDRERLADAYLRLIESVVAH